MDKAKRPILKIPLSSTERLLGLITALVVALTFINVFAAWSNLPDIIPTHYNAAGKIDGTGPKWTVWLVPGVQLVLTLVISIVSRFPHTFNYPWKITSENAGRQYLMARLLLVWLRLELALLFAYLNWKTIQSALNQANGLDWWFLPLTLIAMFGSLGIYLWLAGRMK
ncbi:MAG TPA: DUF1648 domain-containing protein [Chloroflexia bacterium]|nr:DUF1648 domain-containing protein [Chloroflexia bacterium]